MGDYISELPDDILCDIFSYLTVRDAFRVRLLSSRLKNLCDCRSVLQFDAHTILGKHTCYFEPPARSSEFVKAVDQFMKILGAQKISALKIKYRLGNEYASHIDGWISRVTDMKVEELDLDFPFFPKNKSKEYVFPCHLLHTEKRSTLKRLRLTYCNLTLNNCDACTSWLSNLSTIELSHVSLCSSDMELIMSSSSNLKSLSLISCDLRAHMCFQHRSLKRLVIGADCQHVGLSCPRLELFEFTGRANFIFSNVPLLREVSLNHYCELGGCSYLFCQLARDVPQLQTVSLWVTNEVLPLPPSTTMSFLKRLDLHADIPRDFDLLTITHMLYACPLLETLNLELSLKRHSEQHPKRHYVDRPHFHLKEFKIKGAWPGISVMELIEYMLRNGVSLEQVVIVLGAKLSSFVKGHPKFTMWQSINPVVDIIVT